MLSPLQQKITTQEATKCVYWKKMRFNALRRKNHSLLGYKEPEEYEQKDTNGKMMSNKMWEALLSIKTR